MEIITDESSMDSISLTIHQKRMLNEGFVELNRTNRKRSYYKHLETARETARAYYYIKAGRPVPPKRTKAPVADN